MMVYGGSVVEEATINPERSKIKVLPNGWVFKLAKKLLICDKIKSTLITPTSF